MGSNLMGLYEKRKRHQECMHTHTRPCEDTEKAAVCNLRSETSEALAPPHLDLGRPASRTDKFLLFEPLGLGYSIMTA
jgi:hypothetical protein